MSLVKGLAKIEYSDPPPVPGHGKWDWQQLAASKDGGKVCPKYKPFFKIMFIVIGSSISISH